MIASMRVALWISSELNNEVSADDIFDVLLGNITSPLSLIDDVKILALEYEDKLRSFNER